jgi:hypothetical protein
MFRISLISLAARYALYGEPTHGLNSIPGNALSGRAALQLLRHHFMPGPRGHQLLLIARPE